MGKCPVIFSEFKYKRLVNLPTAVGMVLNVSRLQRSRDLSPNVRKNQGCALQLKFELGENVATNDSQRIFSTP